MGEVKEKQYYWLKLQEGFFDEKTTKFLRRMPGGSELVIIYLKMQLKALRTEGFIKYDGLLPTCEEELAMVLDEDVNNVRLTLNALERSGAVERWDNDMLYMVSMQPLIGKESAVAERVRRHRAQKKLLALQCNTDETTCNTEIEKEKEKEIELEKEIDIEIEKRERIDYARIVSAYNETCVSFPQIRSLSEARKKAIAARLHSNYTYEDFEQLFKLAEASTFLKGGNQRNWSATFDWLIKDANMAKVLEGNYNDKEPQKMIGQQPETSNQFLKILMEEGGSL